MENNVNNKEEEDEILTLGDLIQYNIQFERRS